MFPIFFIFASDILGVSARFHKKRGGGPECLFVYIYVK